MLSFCLELKSMCKSCGNPLPINSLSGTIYCDICGFINSFSVENWKSLINENLGELRKFNEGEGRNSKVFMGEYEFSLLLGKQKARCPDCKTTIPDSHFVSENPGEYNCEKCGNIILIRKPDEFVLKVLPFTLFLANEDSSRFETHKDGLKMPKASKPVLFNCPSCAANLAIDGSARMINCNSCGSKIYIPDDLWQELHPVKSVMRWYIMMDDEKMNENLLPEWSDFSDVAADSSGNIYIAGCDDDTDEFLLFSINPDMKVRWVRRDIKFEHDYTGITITKNNKLLLWNKNKRSLLVFSCKDGSELPPIKGSDVSENNPYPFNLNQCASLISDIDDTLLAIVYNTFVRFYEDGTRAPLWSPLQKGEKPGFLSRMFGGDDTRIDIPPKEYESPPNLNEIKHRPKTVQGDYTHMNMGHDGYLYMLDTTSNDGCIAKYDRSGNRIWEKKTSVLKDKFCKPFADKNGFVYILGKDDKEMYKLIRYSNDGENIQILLTDILEGGVLGNQDYIAVTPDGTVFILDTYRSLKVFSPDLKLKYISDSAKEDDNDRLEEAREKIKSGE